jgi:NAD(P)-dependent dehydrogenase (short-subunit alcohol dehydrogenase family)
MKKIGEQYKKALVTGGSSGLGKAFIEMLLAEDVEVWATSRFPERFARHPLLHPLRLDLVNPSEVETFIRFLVDDVPDLDLLINNAGYGVFSPFDAFPKEELAQQLNVLLVSPIIICRHVYESMKRRGRGAIVNVSSLAADPMAAIKAAMVKYAST